MHQQHQQRMTTRQWGNLCSWIVVGWAMTIYIPFRRNVGKEHVGLAGLIGLAWLFGWVMYFHAEPLIFLAGLFLFAIACHLLKHVIRTWRGQFIHTFYGGEAWLARFFFVKDEAKAKGIIEPALALALGVYLSRFDPGVGSYFVGGAFALWGTQLMINKQQQQRVDDMRNGMIENAHLMSQLPMEGRRRF